MGGACEARGARPRRRARERGSAPAGRGDSPRGRRRPDAGRGGVPRAPAQPEAGGGDTRRGARGEDARGVEDAQAPHDRGPGDRGQHAQPGAGHLPRRGVRDLSRDRSRPRGGHGGGGAPHAHRQRLGDRLPAPHAAPPDRTGHEDERALPRRGAGEAPGGARGGGGGDEAALLRAAPDGERAPGRRGAGEGLPRSGPGRGGAGGAGGGPQVRRSRGEGPARVAGVQGGEPPQRPPDRQGAAQPPPRPRPRPALHPGSAAGDAARGSGPRDGPRARRAVAARARAGPARGGAGGDGPPPQEGGVHPRAEPRRELHVLCEHRPPPPQHRDRGPPAQVEAVRLEPAGQGAGGEGAGSGPGPGGRPGRGGPGADRGGGAPPAAAGCAPPRGGEPPLPGGLAGEAPDDDEPVQGAGGPPADAALRPGERERGPGPVRPGAHVLLDGEGRSPEGDRRGAVEMRSPRREAIALGLAALSVACGGKGPAVREARPVRIEDVRAEDEGGRIRYSATIQAYEQVQLAFKTSGYVREVGMRRGSDGRLRYLQQGDEVKRGTVLARIVDSEYQERANQARSQVVEAAASLEKARADGGRAERLYASQSLTLPDYEAAKASLAVAEARALGARAQAETAEIGLRDCALVAPLDGVVLARQVEVGSLAGPGTSGFVVADLSRVKAVFGVPDRLAARARTGTPLSITSDAFGDTPFPGQVTAIAPAADVQSRVFNVEVTIANPNRQLKPGMIATVDVPTSPANAAEERDSAGGLPTVALSAVVKGPKAGGYAVFVAEGPDEKTVARSREVTLGPIAGNRVTVTGGLKAGERVIVSGASFLHDGDPVRVVPGSERS